jgi:hypothetical protein
VIYQAYGDNALSRSRVFEWYTRFWDGCENLEDDERIGQPTAVETSDIIETVRELKSIIFWDMTPCNPLSFN